MTSRAYFLCRTVTNVSVFLAALVLVACERSNPAASATAEPPQTKAASSAASAEKVFLVFDGPWAFAPDPKDANMVLAIAPKTKSHNGLQVSASNKATLPAGIYDLSVPVHSTPTAGAPDATFVQAQVDTKSLNHAIGAKSERYVVRLPKPEAYVAAMRYRSRVGASYPPDPSTEKEYVTSASLRYSVSSLTGFSLAGTPDSGTFKPLLLQVDTPTITFLIDPAIGDIPLDNCSTHSRQAFHDLTKLVNVTLYVDFPESPSGCHDKDPQKPHPAQAEAESPLWERLDALMEENLTDLPLASAALMENSFGHEFLAWVAPGAFMKHARASFYFFGTRPSNCKAPILILSIKP